MTDNPLFLPLAMALIFWAYRELCHLIDKGNWREERQEERKHLQSVLNPPMGWGGSYGRVSSYQNPSSPQPDEELSPAQLKEREEELKARLQRERLAQLEQEKMDLLTSESEAEFSQFLGTGA